ncbi:MAG: AAA family ATPase [Crocinitomicaceae bacterium]
MSEKDLFNSVKKEHVVQAIKEFEHRGVPDGMRDALYYDLIIDGKKYSPKVIMAYANEIATGELDTKFHGGPNTSSFKKLKELGFEVKKKEKWDKDPRVLLIEKYKNLIREKGLKDEVYKWEFVAKYKGFFDDSELISQRIQEVKWTNAIYHMSVATLKGVAKSSPLEVQLLIDILKNEGLSLNERIDLFIGQFKTFYLEDGGKNSAQQDERSISNYLTIVNPEKYTFYKYSYYQKYCDYIGIKTKGKNRKLVHYYRLLDELITNYISKDEELIELVKNEIPDYYDGSNHLLLAQDILYEVLDRERSYETYGIQDEEEIRLIDYLRKLGKDFSEELYIMLETLLGGFDIDRNDPRVCYNLPKSERIGVTFGQRYVLIAEINPKGNFIGYIDTINYDQDNWYQKVKTWKDFRANYDAFKVSAGIELKRTKNKSSYTESSSEVLKNSIYNLKYRKYIFNEAFNQNIRTGKGGIEFFNSEDFNLIEEFSKVRRQKDNAEHHIAYQELREIYDKVKYWMDEVQQRIFPLGFTDIRRSPINQGQYFESYQWGKIYPDQNAPKELAYTVAISDNHELHVKIDTVSLADDDWRRQKYFDYRGEWDESSIIKTFVENEVLENDWEYLITETIDFFISIESDYKKILNLITIENSKNMKQPLNQILYGPPGTGKTWYLQNHYFSNYTTMEESVTAEQHFNDVVQDLSWWQVIGIALIELGNCSVSDLMANRWVARKAANSESKNVRATVWANAQIHTIEECESVKYKNRQPPLIFNKQEDKTWQILEEEAKETAPELYEILDSVNNFNPQKGKSLKRYEFVTFHQSYSYEDFIEGIKPVMADEGTESEDLKYEIKSGIFKELCKRAESDPENTYALFIDEINRGNVSAIFGELITLIEDDKRKGMENQVTLVLPYSRLKFSVPQNLHIIGTMNTADRSVEALDTALRRRFTFKEMMPNPELLKEKEVGGISLQKVLETINERVEMLIDRDHTIGHSYFINLKENKQALADAFNDKIIPLLQEYFYGDYGKIGLVLGKGFVSVKKAKNDVFADFSYENSTDFISNSYELKKVDETTIIEALKELLGEAQKEDQAD